MSGVFPELNSLSLSELQERFRAAPPDPELEDFSFWYDEVAVDIRERDPDEGARFLRGEVDWEDPDRLASIMLAITWFYERDSHHADLVVECLEHPDELVVARAIDDLAGLGGRGFTERVLAMGADPRELVRGAVLRFARQIMPDRAPALLLDCLEDPHWIVRTNAVDELDELEYTAALPRITALLKDPHSHVRAAALEAIANLAPSSAAIALLLEALHDPEATARVSAVSGLDSIEQFNDLDVLEQMLEDPDEDVRWHARDALERRGG